MSAYARMLLEAHRIAQTKRVMPLIGNLVDQWEMVPNDILGVLDEQCPAFVAAMNKVRIAADIGDND
jgi:hypothetical protein